MSGSVSTHGKRVKASNSTKRTWKRLHERHQIIIDGEVWALAKEKFANVSRIYI
ncbi:hypothetical protein K1720_00440 [Thermococcus argininiproducens]|uniref:Uncharacterized protein n=1 Tax=Thermococcus argininiproducens TaxID=2866384 RepID=A0A9E7SCH3_9EURY|nr:hypothetical protein [Thermococcus argininiproducens]USG99993.1 hypothetical protein K1720_00440 [Thermococcus argininiproducens]